MLTTFTLVIISAISVFHANACPDGWVRWKDEKCFLLTKGFSNFADAKKVCESQSGTTLVNVKGEEEQLFLTNYIFEASEVDIGVWIGGTRVSDSHTDFQWEDGTPFDYTNWAVGSPTELDGRNCVHMLSNFTLNKVESQGTWRDTSCNSPMYYVCETKPMWSLEEVVRALIETRRNLDETRSTLDGTNRKLDETSSTLDETKQKLDETRDDLDDTNRKLEEQIRNPVPIGFIYTQFPHQPIPSVLWPVVTWTEVTSRFAGQFFRAAGGSAAGFGETQQADSPRLREINTVRGQMLEGQAHITPGRWTDARFSGDTTGVGGRDRLGIQFLVTNVEVRPINTAIRIWKRSA